MWAVDREEGQVLSALEGSIRELTVGDGQRGREHIHSHTRIAIQLFLACMNVSLNGLGACHALRACPSPHTFLGQHLPGKLHLERTDQEQAPEDQVRQIEEEIDASKVGKGIRTKCGRGAVTLFCGPHYHFKIYADNSPW